LKKKKKKKKKHIQLMSCFFSFHFKPKTENKKTQIFFLKPKFATNNKQKYPIPILVSTLLLFFFFVLCTQPTKQVFFFSRARFFSNTTKTKGDGGVGCNKKKFIYFFF